MSTKTSIAGELVVLLLALPIATATAPTSPAAALEQEEGPVERLTAWPEPADEAALEKDVARLRKASTDEMGLDADRQLRAVGAAAAPYLLKALGKEKDEKARARVVAVLEHVTGPAHTRLLAQHFDDRSEEVRTFALERTAALPDPGLADAALAALERALEGGAKTSPRELHAAALAVTATGSIAGLDALRAHAVAGPGDPVLRRTLEAVRGPEASERVAAWLADPDRRVRAAALEMLAGCGDEGVTPRVKPFLDEQDNTLRIGAINALRGIVDGEPPIDKLPVFEAIELAKRWKERV